MSNSYIGSDLDDIGFDEGPNVDNESDQDEDPSRTFKVRIILASNRPPPETFADLIHYHNALNNWMREAEGLFNFDKNNPVKLDTCEWMHEGKEAPLPTDEELKDAHAVIVAGSMDASDESEEWNEQLRTYIERIYSEYPKLQFFGIGYGHQIIAQAVLGGIVKVEKRKKSPENWDFGLREVMLEPEFKAAFPAFQEKDAFSLQFLNCDRVVLKDGATLPIDWKVVGKSRPDTIQGLWLDSKLLTFQGLPEFNKYMIKNRVREKVKGEAFSAEEAKSHLARAMANPSERKEDDILFGRVLYQFFSRHEKIRDHTSSKLPTKSLDTTVRKPE